MKLSEVAHGRDNNFNLIRVAAALAVLFTHSFALTTGHGSAEPLRAEFGVTWGVIAVNVFFVTSGFLVTGSLMSRKGAIAFIWARILRIYPALWVMLAVTVFGLGLALTARPTATYLTAAQTWHYFLHNAIVFDGITYLLPGVFIHNPIHKSVNGALWSLTPEVRIYGLLLLVWMVAAAARSRRLEAFRIVVFAIAVVSGFLYLHERFFELSHYYPRLTFMFFTGAIFYLMKEEIELRRSIAVALLMMVAVSMLQRTVFFFVLSLSLPYILMVGAYLVGGQLRAFNRLGDYSYGIYIYTWPVQQTLVSLFPHISIAALMVSSAIVTAGLAVLSWHVIESRVLRRKEACAVKTRRWIESHFGHGSLGSEA